MSLPPKVVRLMKTHHAWVLDLDQHQPCDAGIRRQSRSIISRHGRKRCMSQEREVEKKIDLLFRL